MLRKEYFRTARTRLPLSGGAHLVGILNATPDSFSDGGDYATIDAAVRQVHAMVAAGAAVVDIGGESTRPGHTPVSAAEEMARVVPLIEAVRPETEALISIDTSKAEVADAALAAGADIVNDVWGAQRDPAMAAVIARHGAACFLMHNRPAEGAGGGDVVEAVLDFWATSVAVVREAGVAEDAIALDPGLGFGKTFEENWAVMRRLGELRERGGYPLFVGASRKSMLGRLLGRAEPKDRLSGTLAVTALAVQAEAAFVRVHDVSENLDVLRVVKHCSKQP